MACCEGCHDAVFGPVLVMPDLHNIAAETGAADLGVAGFAGSEAVGTVGPEAAIGLHTAIYNV